MQFMGYEMNAWDPTRRIYRLLQILTNQKSWIFNDMNRTSVCFVLAGIAIAFSLFTASAEENKFDFARRNLTSSLRVLSQSDLT